MPSLRHYHIYERVKSKPHLYKCVHAECSHYIHRDFLPGKRATCVCGNEFIITSKSLRLKKLHCEKCTRNTKSKAVLIEKILTTPQNNEIQIKPQIHENNTVTDFFFPDTDEIELEIIKEGEI